MTCTVDARAAEIEAVRLVDTDRAKVIMVVDDEAAVVAVIKVNLKLAGYKVMEAFDGQQALDHLQEQTPDLVLLDIAMPPGMDGVDVLRRMRNSDKTRHIPVVMLTAYGSTEARAEAEKLGCYLFVDKPFEPAELVSIVGRVLAAADEERMLEGEA